MKIAYGKLGRSIPLTLDGASNVGGDIEVVRLLQLLLEQHEVHLVSRNRCDLKQPNLVNHWNIHNSQCTFFDAIDMGRGMERFPDDPRFVNFKTLIELGASQLPEFDAWFIWLGQHGSTLSYLPRVQPGKALDPRLAGVTRPLISDINYGFPIVHMLNTLDVQPHWLCPDPRNRIKFRDLENPRQHTVLAQFNTTKDNTFYKPGIGIQRGGTRYKYTGIELLAVPPPHGAHVCPWFGEEPYRHRFGLLVNEGYSNLGKNNRVEFVKRWTPFEHLPLSETEIFGHWSTKSQADLGMTITPVALAHVDAVLQRWRATMTFPATASGWATAKPWECFKNGCICFKHPGYDTQEHIYGKHMPEQLRSFLCPPTVAGFRRRITDLEDTALWERMAALQWDYLLNSYQRLEHGAVAVNNVLTQTRMSHGG